MYTTRCFQFYPIVRTHHQQMLTNHTKGGRITNLQSFPPSFSNEWAVGHIHHASISKRSTVRFSSI